MKKGINLVGRCPWERIHPHGHCTLCARGSRLVYAYILSRADWCGVICPVRITPYALQILCARQTTVVCCCIGRCALCTAMGSICYRLGDEPSLSWAVCFHHLGDMPLLFGWRAFIFCTAVKLRHSSIGHIRQSSHHFFPIDFLPLHQILSLGTNPTVFIFYKQGPSLNHFLILLFHSSIL